MSSQTSSAEAGPTPQKVVVLYCDGRTEVQTISTGDTNQEIWATLHDLYRMIGCDTVELVGLAPGLSMWLDEEGIVNGATINRAATLLAAQYGLTHQPYFGTAVLSADNDEGEVVGLDPAVVADLLAMMDRLAAAR